MNYLKKDKRLISQYYYNFSFKIMLLLPATALSEGDTMTEMLSAGEGLGACDVECRGVFGVSGSALEGL